MNKNSDSGDSITRETDEFLQAHVCDKFPTKEEVLANLTEMMQEAVRRGDAVQIKSAESSTPTEDSWQIQRKQSTQQGSCPPRIEGVGAITGTIVPRNETVWRDITDNTQPGTAEEETDDWSGSDDEGRRGMMTSTPISGLERRSREQFKECSQLISPLVPRVDTWLGPSEVSRVPMREHDSLDNGDYDSAEGETAEEAKGLGRELLEELLERVVNGGAVRCQGVETPEDPRETVNYRYAAYEPDNCRDHGVKAGPTQSAPVISPLAPRVVTWLGLRHVSSVPKNVCTQLNTEYQGERNTEGDGREERGDELEVGRQGDNPKDAEAWTTGAGDGTSQSITCYKVSTESDNLECHGTRRGPTKSAQRITSHAPRENIWRGLSPVNIVPNSVNARSKILEQGRPGEQTGDSWSNRGEEAVETGKASSHTSHTAPACQKIESVESRSAQLHTNSNGNVVLCSFILLYKVKYIHM